MFEHFLGGVGLRREPGGKLTLLQSSQARPLFSCFPSANRRTTPCQTNGVAQTQTPLPSPIPPATVSNVTKADGSGRGADVPILLIHSWKPDIHIKSPFYEQPERVNNSLTMGHLQKLSSDDTVSPRF